MRRIIRPAALALAAGGPAAAGALDCRAAEGVPEEAAAALCAEMAAVLAGRAHPPLTLTLLRKGPAGLTVTLATGEASLTRNLATSDAAPDAAIRRRFLARLAAGLLPDEG